MGYEKDIFAVLRMTSNSHTNHGEAVYIIKTKSCILSIPQELYIIKPQEEYTLARDEIQCWLSDLDDMHRTSCGDDIPSLRLG